MDTANTFKLGIFPFTNDPTNSNGNGANGPCWARDADNFQGFTTGPLAASVDEPRTPRVCRSTPAPSGWARTRRRTNHAYDGVAVTRSRSSSRWPNFPMAVDPARMGLNITPYDNDNTAAAGSTTLRHIDNSARLAWSTFGSVQSDPYRWGRATLPGYTPPADRPTTPRTPTSRDPTRRRASPQTIAQSARNGVPISGREPAPGARGITITGANLAAGGPAQPNGRRPGPRARVPLRRQPDRRQQELHARVEHELRPGDEPGAGLRAVRLRAADGTTPPWAPDMMGGIVRRRGRHPGRGQRARSRSRSTPRRRRGWPAAPPCSCPSPRRRTRCRRSTCRSPRRAAAWAARCRRRSRSRSARRPRSAPSRRASRRTTSRPRPRP